MQYQEVHDEQGTTETAGTNAMAERGRSRLFAASSDSEEPLAPAAERASTSNTNPVATKDGATPEDVRRALAFAVESASNTGPAATMGGSSPASVRRTNSPQRVSSEQRWSATARKSERQREILRKEIKLQRMEIELLKLEEEPSEMGKAEEWLRVTDRCGEESVTSEDERAQRYVSFPDYQHRYTSPCVVGDTMRSPEFIAWRQRMDARVKASTMAALNGDVAMGARMGENTMAAQREAVRESGTYATRRTIPAREIHGEQTSHHPSFPHRNTDTYHYGTFGVTTLSQSQISARQVTSRELPMFSGSVEEWPIFLANFEHSTALCGYSDEENLLRLQRALKGPARDMVGHLLLLPAGLKDAMSTLKARYGRPELIVEAMMEQVRRLPAPRTDKLETLVNFGFAVRSLCATARATGMHEFFYNMALLRELTNKLPPITCVEWARYRKQFTSVSLADFGKWIGDLAEDVSGVIPCPSIVDTRREPERRYTSGPPKAHGFLPRQWQQQTSRTDQRQPFRPDQQFQRTDQHQRETVHMNVHAKSRSSGPESSETCILCDGSCDSLAACDRFRGTTVDARRAFVSERKLCKRCLGYHWGRCNVVGECGIDGCSYKHHRLLHEETAPPAPRQTLGYFNMHTDRKDVLLKYLPVIIHGPRGRVSTYAFLDDGSTSSYMDHGLLAELGLTGTPHPMRLQWTGHVTREEENSVRVAIRVSGRNATAATYELQDVRTVRDLGLPIQSISVPQLAGKYEHLKNLPIHSYCNIMPRILIGVDNCSLGQPETSVAGSRDEPIAAETRLGWVVYGPCPVTTKTSRSDPHACIGGLLTREAQILNNLEAEIDRTADQLCDKDDDRCNDDANCNGGQEDVDSGGGDGGGNRSGADNGHSRDDYGGDHNSGSDTGKDCGRSGKNVESCDDGLVDSREGSRKTGVIAAIRAKDEQVRQATPDSQWYLCTSYNESRSVRSQDEARNTHLRPAKRK